VGPLIADLSGLPTVTAFGRPKVREGREVAFGLVDIATGIALDYEFAFLSFDHWPFILVS
jgi:hypothetical protein